MNESGTISLTDAPSSEVKGSFQVLQTSIPAPLHGNGANSRTSQTALLCGAWALVLGRYTSSDQVLFETALVQPARIGTLDVNLDPTQPIDRFLEGVEDRLSRPGMRILRVPLAPEKSTAETGIFLVDTEQGVTELSARLTDRALGLQVTVRTGDGCVEWRYNPKAFRPHTIAALSRCFARVPEDLASMPNKAAGDVRLLKPNEEQQILSDSSRAHASFDEAACVHHFFEQQAARTPDAVAIVFQDKQWTYKELDAKANELADRLLSNGIQRGDLVAVALNRSLELVAALIGVLKVGAAYVPLDPSYPAPRISFMLEDAHPVAVIVSERTAEKIPRTNSLVLRVDDGGEPRILENRSDPKIPSSSPAYVIYTSGSTGKPKGVIVTHRNVVNFFGAMDEIIGNEPGVWLAVSSVSFDISVFELFWTLTRGFRVIIHEEGQLASPTNPAYSLPRQMRRHGVTHFQCTPSLASILVRDVEALGALKSVRRVMVGGEALSLDLAHKLARAVSGVVFNMYGPTETTIWSLAGPVGCDDEAVSIGRPIANTQVYVLDAQHRLVPAGFPGELYVGGAGVAVGYLNQPELTIERFIANPFGKTGDRIYRTGDIVRYQPDGTLEFLGRADQQIKIRGFRIELGEIENVLRQHPQIRDAVVVVSGGPGEGTDKQLVAYVISVSAGAITGREIRSWLRQQFPEPMVPSAVVLINQFPQTPNGKLDKNALPKPQVDSDQETELPRTEMEGVIASVWGDVLGVKGVPLTRPFFDLGGHSLLMVEVHDQLQYRMGIEIALVDLFRYPTVRALANHLGQETLPKQSSHGTDRGLLRQQASLRKVVPRKIP